MFWKNSELRQRAKRLVHRQANDVRVGAADGADDLGAVSLRSVGTCFIERVYLGEIGSDLLIGKLQETHMGNDVEARHHVLLWEADKDAGANLVFLAT